MKRKRKFKLIKLIAGLLLVIAALIEAIADLLNSLNR